jgi:hypothetical protein
LRRSRRHAAGRHRPRASRLLVAGALIVTAVGLPAAVSQGTGIIGGGGKEARPEAAAPIPAAGALKPAEQAARTAATTAARAVPKKPVTPQKDDPRRGLVHKGLKPATSGACLGAYDAGSKQCTHGPDVPPPGLDVTKDVPPIAATPAATERAGAEPADEQLAAEAAPSAGSGTAAASPWAVPCDGDGTSGNRVQVLYVHAATDRYAQYLESFRTWSSGIDTIYSASAAQTGGERHVRFVTEAVGGECRAIVTDVTVSAGALGDFGATNRELGTQGFNRKDRKYVIFAESNVYCGIGSFAGDDRKTAQNRSNFGPSYGRTDAGCWGASTAAHELGHNLGAVSNSAPNTSRGGHCVDEYDVMCYSDSPNFPQMQVKCGDRNNNSRLDCNHDDYYSTNPAPGSYLATRFNVADNVFLVQGAGGGGGGGTTPPPADTTAPSAPAGLTAASVTATGLTLSWSASSDNVAVTGYEVRRDGAAIGTTSGPSLAVTGLTARTAYRFTVVAKDAAGNTSGESTALAVTTAAAGGGGGGTGPAAGVPYVLTNGLTGRVADVFRASTASGAAVIQYPAHGGTNQRWTFADLGGGTYAITSAASGLCLDARGSRGRIVQYTCSATATTQRWTVTTSGTGVTLSPASAPTQVLGLSNATLDGARVLGLRTPSASVAESTVWTLAAS